MMVNWWMEGDGGGGAPPDNIHVIHATHTYGNQYLLPNIRYRMGISSKDLIETSFRYHCNNVWALHDRVNKAIYKRPDISRK